jgi:3-methyladenine DNA glycosylase AlkC
LNGLDALEFKARAMQVADALEQTMPQAFADAASVLEGSLSPPLPFNDKGEPEGLGQPPQDGVAGWILWGYGEFVARRGMGEVPRALKCLHAITQRFTAEYAIRPFIDQQPDQTLPVLELWAQDPSPHVRRLASEGSRPRLPWGIRLQSLVIDPSPTEALLRKLQDDPVAYVRRSVANHLNDIAKDHPERIARWLHRYLPGASDERRALLRHASRTLIKQGHRATLNAWGLGQAFAGTASLTLSAQEAKMGDGISLDITLQSASTASQKLVIDYAVHHVRANGSTSPKVFKGWNLTLEGQAPRHLSKRHSLRPITTRQLYPGLHRLDLRINGEVCASTAFQLLPASA